MALLRVVDNIYGDKRVEWSTADKIAKKKAKQLFDEKLGKKWIAYRVNKGKDPEMITKFDPKADTIIITPPVAGG